MCCTSFIATSYKIVFETPIVVITLVMFDVAALIGILHCYPCTRPFGAGSMKLGLLSPAGVHWSSFGCSVPALPAHKCAQDDR